MFLRKFTFLLSVLFFTAFTASGFAQIGINTEEPHENADLELGSTDKAFLVNRVPNVSVIGNPVNGMIVYDESENCLMVYQADEWICLTGSSGSDPDNPDNPDPFPTFPDKITKIFINTETGEDPPTKTNYVTGTMTIDSQGGYDDFIALPMGVRGRGNSSWYYFPKKGFRIKLNDSEGLFGLASAKNWVIIPDYLDGSMLDFSIAFEMGRVLGMPYTNKFIPVEVYMNNDYRGIYGFSEHKEVKSGRIDLTNSGTLLELDFHYDEPGNQFKDANYDLPVVIKYPKDENLTPERFDAIESEFNALTSLVQSEDFPNNNYRDYFDAEQFVNFLMVMSLTLNHEINNPGSVYMHKVDSDSKFTMGIIWDFDWAYGFNYSENHSHYDLDTADQLLFTWKGVTANKPGFHFFKRIIQKDPYMQGMFQQRWTWFKQEKLENLKNYVAEYARVVVQGYDADHDRWYNEPYPSIIRDGISEHRGATGDIELDLQRVMAWLDARVAHIDNWIATGYPSED